MYLDENTVETLVGKNGIRVRLIRDDSREGLGQSERDVEAPDSFCDEEYVALVAGHRQFSHDARLYVSGAPKGSSYEKITVEDVRSALDDDEDNAERRASFEADWHVFPLIAYIHSGVALSLSRDGYPFNDRFDSGQVGFVLVKKFIEGIGDIDEARANEIAKGTVATWNQYLSGDVYGVLVEEQDEDGEWTEIESCWGYYGREETLVEARSQLDFYDAKAAKDAGIEAEERAALNTVGEVY